MRELYRQYPEDDEIAILYTLSLLGSAEATRDTRTYMQAAAVAEDVYQRNKNHPGALHYVIHAYDDPIHAPLGLRAARAYAKTSPQAAHALHMPSHIFIALGLWNDMIASNQAAWDAGMKLNKHNDAKAFTIHDLHALQWLAYGHLQQRHDDVAYKLTKKMQYIALKTNTPMTKWYYAQMRAAYLTDSGDHQADLQSIDNKGVELSAYAVNIYADVQVAKRQCDIQKMRLSLDELSNAIPTYNPNKTYRDYFTSITKSGVLTAQITVLEIKAQIAQCQQNIHQAISYLQQAAKLEGNASFGYGPPIPVKPSFELLADILLQDKQYTEAYQQYIVTLKRMPNRASAMHGLNLAKRELMLHHLPVPEGIKPYFTRLILPEYYH
jgi:tetratricopeptide (TPR) repeat protein